MSTQHTTTTRGGFRPAYFLGRRSAVYAVRYAPAATVVALPSPVEAARAA